MTHLAPSLGLAISDVRHARVGSAAAACVTHAVPRAAAHALAIEADAVGRLRRPCVATFSATLRCTCRASTRGRREERGGGSAPTRVLACLHWKHIQRTHRSAGFFVLGPSHYPLHWAGRPSPRPFQIECHPQVLGRNHLRGASSRDGCEGWVRCGCGGHCALPPLFFVGFENEGVRGDAPSQPLNVHAQTRSRPSPLFQLEVGIATPRPPSMYWR